MKRRDFIKSSIALSLLGKQVPLFAYNRAKYTLQRSTQWDTDRIVVLIKLNGGNDGLNTIIPTNNDVYYEKRPNLAINPSDTIMISDEMGFHPSMSPVISLYQNEKMGIIHGVGYPDPNLSHFRSSDIWVTGSNSNEHWNTGWLGRLFQLEYPDFPDNSPEFPLAIQFKSANLLEFQMDGTNAGNMVFDPEVMYQIVTGNYVPSDNDPPPQTAGGDELSFIREVDLNTFEYSGIIYDSAINGTTTVDYPNSNISTQLALTSKLISGGLNTPVYRLSQSGYDTHANQLGTHAELLSDVCEAVQAFITDMENQGLQDRVLVMTTSEFGRRVEDNYSNGTDHGTSGPMMIFGSQAQSGFFGNQPDLSNLDQNENLLNQFDFRQLYSTLITDWFGLSQDVAETVFQSPFETIPFIRSPLSTIKPIPVASTFKIEPAFPNPFNPATQIRYHLPKKSSVTIRVLDGKGCELKSYLQGVLQEGDHTFILQGNDLSSGLYFLQVESGGNALTQKVTLLK
ncbi:MAG: DUF1501 domain-containing protein [Candidatus Marinimicrobia bacterium]|nr:DUF1501 domain-containing protein [Candidatus Neomarinimicrobiota bacterium]MBT3961565.1 DUF1501 domain-containing protein [Candidatus Neomarinimicrobiota bacterium]MBT4636098.1 DUF1501 domain-containing protein [Candidatus Neomarinimicrobiota bacterium]MBT4685884.1 DUF1501 domain-containing protein [Candidatus Neomarinimicrobiota bacterium]MBT5069477.1 DUF1501 domain-containing protein [Candidatus Neomarinimicrobiota bacterium]